MAEVRWAPQAAEDLESIAEFIAQDSTHYEPAPPSKNLDELIEEVHDDPTGIFWG